MQNKTLHQEIFNTVAKHLLTQNKRSEATDGLCMYRSDAGLRCAIGCLIPDEKYSAALEGMGMDRSEVKNALPDKYQCADMSFLCSLQSIHDACSTWSWKEELRGFANNYGLSSAAVLNFTKE